MDSSNKKTFAQIIQDDRLVLVDFYAEWCGPCQVMKPILKELKDALGSDITILKVDVDRNPSASQKYSIKGVPTLILFRKGQIIWQHSGVLSVEQLKKVVLQY